MVLGGTEDPTGSLRRGLLEYCVLAMLAREPLYAFDVVRRLGALDGLATSEGTIYPLLTRLRTKGWLSSTWVPSDAGPPRRYYDLTQGGRRVLDVFADDWRRVSATVDALLPRPENT